MLLQKLLATREANKALLKRRIDSITEDTSNDELGDVVQYMEEKINIVKALNNKISSQCEPENLQREIEDAEEYVFETEQHIKHILRSRRASVQENNTANAMQTRGKVENTESSFSNPGNQFNSTSLHRLPKLILPEFNGEVTNWQTFWDTFESAIHNNQSLADVQKFTYLRSLLHDTAARCIEGFPLTNNNYRAAVDLLKERFGQTHTIVSSHMQTLLDLPAPRHHIGELENFVDQIETNVRGLEALGQSEQNYGGLLVPIILGKLSSEILRNMTREHGESSWTLDQLRKALHKEVCILQAGQRFQKSETRATASFLTRAEPRWNSTNGQRHWPTQFPQKRCAFCNNPHLSHECRSVTSTSERKDIVKRKRLCFNCLGDHRVSECISKHRCRNCKRKHHTSICDAITTGNVDATPFKADEHLQEAVLHSTCRNDVLLKTAIADVEYHLQIAQANILFDEGAQRSFITEHLAAELALPMQNREFVKLAAFGENMDKGRYFEKGRVYLKTDAGSIPIDVLVIPTIAAPLQNIPQRIQQLPYLRDLKLAHPISGSSSFAIDMLIGADFYWDIVGNHIVRGNGPTAVASKLGYLLSGPLQSTKVDNETHMMNIISSLPDTTSFDMEKFWKLESIGINQEPTETDERSILKEYQEKNISFEDKHYVAKLPWTKKKTSLPKNMNHKDVRNQPSDVFAKTSISSKGTEIS